MAKKVPSYRLHKATAQAVVTLNGRDVYLGKHGTPESHRRYAEELAKWHAAADEAPQELSIAQLTLLYLGHARQHYTKAGAPTSKLHVVQSAIKFLNREFRHLAARELSPKRLTTVRAAMIESGLSRSTINDYVGCIRRMVKWAVAEELLSPERLVALQAVRDLQRGRSAARETEDVKPVPQAFIDAVKPHVQSPVWGAIRFQLLSGARPGEALQLRGCDLDTSGAVWLYTPATHKNEHRGKRRAICIGPAGQKLLREHLTTDLTAYVFGTVKSGGANAYRRDSYTNAIARACRAETKARREAAKKAGRNPDDVEAIPVWGPNRLRHNFATLARKSGGIESARVVLGHSSAVTSEIYAERDLEAARAVVAKIG